MKLPSIDKKMQWVARIFFAAFSISLYGQVTEGSYQYHSMGYFKVVSADSSPFKFYASVIWSSVIVIVSAYFGFIAKRK